MHFFYPPSWYKFKELLCEFLAEAAATTSVFNTVKKKVEKELKAKRKTGSIMPVRPWTTKKWSQRQQNTKVKIWCEYFPCKPH